MAVFLGYRLYESLPSKPLQVACACVAWVIPVRWDGALQQQSLADRTRQAFSRLGPVAIKMGQMLSTRHDLLDPATAAALAHLQDKMPYFPTEQAIDIICTSFELPLDKLFERFDQQPLAAASIAQIHTARLSPNASPDGLSHEVIIKVIRPDIKPAILKETKTLKVLASMATKLIPELKRFHLGQVVDDYQATVLAECDLRLEAANTLRFKADFQDSELLYVPTIYDPWIRENVFIMERVSGLPVNDIDNLKAAGVDLAQLSEIGATIFLTQVFKNNFFHADMHPGNILVDITNPRAPKYIALDCAIAGTLNPRDHRLLARKLLALINQDYLKLARLLITGGWVPADTHRLALAQALEVVCSPILSKPLSEIEFGPLLANLFSTARQFELQALPQFVLLEKTLLHVEGLGRQLDPDLDIWALGQPLLSGWLKDDLLSLKTLSNAQDTVIDALGHAPEAIEDWYETQLGSRPSPVEATGERLKRIEHRLERQHQHNQKQFYAACLFFAAAIVYTVNSSVTLPFVFIAGAGLWYLKPK